MARVLSLALCLAAAQGTEGDWLSFPAPGGGALLLHRDCVHRADGAFHVESGEGGDVLWQDGHRQELEPCPHAPKRLGANASTRYYSDWAAYAQTTHSGGFGRMSSDWAVPARPTSTGPVPGMSSAYLFNGLEDSGGKPGTATFILQPVLTYGKSGCILDPLNFFHWHFISFLVTNAGRGYCGQRLRVEEGEQLRGIMSLDADGETWTVQSTRLSNNETSTYSAKLKGAKPDAAYLTLETMVNYGCNAFPASGSVTFAANSLAAAGGAEVRPSWEKRLPHTECNQQVSFGPDGAVTISWDAQSALLLA